MKGKVVLSVGIVGLLITAFGLGGCISQPGLQNLQAELETLYAENAGLEAEMESLQLDYDDLNTRYDELNSQKESISNELSQLEELCPPKEFSSLTELRTWVQNNEVSEIPASTYAEDWMARAYQLQEDALHDGYVISVDYDYDEEGYYVYNTAIVNGTIFYWDPESDEVLEEFGFGTIK